MVRGGEGGGHLFTAWSKTGDGKYIYQKDRQSSGATNNVTSVQQTASDI